MGHCPVLNISKDGEPTTSLNSLFQRFSFFIVNIFSPNISSEFPLLLHVMDLMILVGPFQLGTFYDSYEERQERLRDPELFSLAKKRLREILSMSINTRKEGARGTEPSSFQWWPVPGQEAIGINQRAQEFAPEHFHTVQVIEHHKTLLREVVEPPSLEIFKSCLDMVLVKWL